MTTIDDHTRAALLDRLVDLSLRLSRAAPAIKPFLRFPRDPALLEATQRIWDFDHLIQVRLARLRRTLASADEIVAGDIAQWAQNLAAWEQGARALLHRARHGDAAAARTYDDVTLNAREQMIVEALGPGARLLYIGAGTGKECLKFAGHGLRVTGIDTLTGPLSVGQQWARFLARDVSLVGIDFLHMGFAPGSFDGALLEFYGSWPARSQTLRAQRGLARVLTPDGRGFIVAARKHYPSYWHMIAVNFPPALADYLAPQTALDFRYTARDEATERQVYGLYWQSHTHDSLRDELSETFTVHACRVLDDDPRYIVAEVQPRADIDLAAPVPDDGAGDAPQVPIAEIDAIDATLDAIDLLVLALEVHARRMADCFGAGHSGAHCFDSLQANIPATIGLIDDIVSGVL